MDHWLDILRAQVAASSRQAVADALGVSRTSISLLMSGKYTARTDLMAARVVDVFSRFPCPHSGQLVSPAECVQRAGQMPTSSPGALRWWRACQSCPHKPQP